MKAMMLHYLLPLKTTIFLLAFPIISAWSVIPENPNVILIVCDDLNDFEGIFGGHPQAKTPELDAFAAGAVRFSNAHSNAPICGPSRSSFMTGIYPHVSNNYAFDNWYNPTKSNFAVNTILQNSKTLMRYMRDNGYKSYNTGKIMHYDLDDDYVFPAGHPEAGNTQQDWDETGAKSSYGPMVFDPAANNGNGAVVNHPKIPQTFYDGAGSLNSLFASLEDVPTVNGNTGWWTSGWSSAGAFQYTSENDRDDMQDESVRKWAVNKINALAAGDPSGENEKFFLAVGFHNPHTPLIAPQSYFDLYPLDTLQLPQRIADDVDDTYFNRNLKPNTSTLICYSSLVDSVGEASPDGTTYATEEAFLKEYLQAYLACVSFVDTQIGELLDALDASPYANNTIVILTSDHGYEFGEKEVLSKNTLWENSTRVPLVIRVPGLEASAGKAVDEPVSLIDLFPTVRDLCGLTTDTKKNASGADLNGYSLRPLLEDPDAGIWDGPDYALSMVSGESSDNPHKKNFAVRSKNWRYIRYRNGQEELYDVANDPYEFTNLVTSNDTTVKAKYAELSLALLTMMPDLATASHNLLVDADFDWLSETHEPSQGTTPWFTTETSNDWQITRDNTTFYDGAYSVEFQNRWTSSPVAQTLVDTLNANLEYSFSFWMLTESALLSSPGINDPSMSVELWTSQSANGSFSHRASFITAVQNTTADTWEQFTGTIDASALSAYSGEYLQIRFVRNDNVEHSLFIDTCSLVAYTPNSFEDWANTKGINPIGGLFDNDNDGVSNKAEFALGGNPQSHQSKAHPVTLERNGSDFIFSYPRRKVSNLNYTVEMTNDLSGSWDSGSVTELPITESFDSEYDKVSNQVSGGSGKQFMRVTAVEN